MPRYVAFLRGINLGKRRLSMSQLRSLFEELNFDDVATFIASGNVVFSSGVKDAARLEKRIARHLESSLGYDVDTFLRTEEEVTAIGRAAVFSDSVRAGDRIHVALLHERLSPAVARKLTAVRTAVDEFRVLGREYYWLCRVRTSESNVWTLPEIKALRMPPATMRNMTSIRKLIAKHLT